MFAKATTPERASPKHNSISQDGEKNETGSNLRQFSEAAVQNVVLEIKLASQVASPRGPLSPGARRAVQLAFNGGHQMVLAPAPWGRVGRGWAAGREIGEHRGEGHQDSARKDKGQRGRRQWRCKVEKQERTWLVEGTAVVEKCSM